MAGADRASGPRYLLSRICRVALRGSFQLQDHLIDRQAVALLRADRLDRRRLSRRAGCSPSSSPRPPRAAARPRPCRPPPTSSRTSSPGIGAIRNCDRSGGTFSIRCCANGATCAGSTRATWLAPRAVSLKPARVARDAAPSARSPSTSASTSRSPGVYSSAERRASSPSTVDRRRSRSTTSMVARRRSAPTQSAGGRSRLPSWPSIRRARSASAVAAKAATAASVRISSADAGAPWKPSGYSSAMKPVVMLARAEARMLHQRRQEIDVVARRPRSRTRRARRSARRSPPRASAPR